MPEMGSLLQSGHRAKVTSDCSSRLNVHHEASSACVVTRNDEGLLVWVPYGSRPGWDLPGGQKHSGESACQTAERETCEETGFQVRAVEKLSGNVFKCEIVAANMCKNPVDEGFLKKKWATVADLNGLQYRGGTWGDKKDFLRRVLRSNQGSKLELCVQDQHCQMSGSACKCTYNGGTSIEDNCKCGVPTP